MDLRTRLRRLRRRLRRLERRELAAVRRWLEDTENLLHLSVLLFVPATVAIVTGLANATPSLSFLLFPPLASGAYTLFSDPEGRHADPVRFVVGLTVGAACGWIALVATQTAGTTGVSALAAGLAVLLTGLLTWALDVEEPAAYAVALLLLVQEAPPAAYVASVAVASGIVAVAYVGWHDGVYERRAELLYASTGTDDEVLVPMVEGAEPVSTLAARIASGYEHGRVVLLGFADGDALEGPAAIGPAPTVADDAVDREGAPDGGTTAEAFAPDDASRDDPSDEQGRRDDPDRRDALVARLEARAERLAAETGAAVEVAVATGTDTATITREAARETGCDLVVAPLDGDGEASFVTSLFSRDLDVGAARVSRERWSEILVPIRSAGDLAHVKVDIARRLAGPEGRVTVAHCIEAEEDRRHAEAICANVVDPYDGRFETLVAQTSIDEFLADHASANDLVMLGASTDRGRVSRLLSRPTYERVTDLPTDLLVVHAGRR